jgi:transcriptional regulator with XRE-family HTH domain
VGRKTLRAPKPTPYPSVPVILGDHLRRRRIDLGLLQRELANQLGMSESSVPHWERNTTAPAIRFVPRIIAFLGYDPYPEPIDLSQRLFCGRRRQGLSICGLAKHLGINPETLRRWERGIRIPRRRWRDLVEGFLDRG